MPNQAFTPDKNDAAMAMLGQIFGPVMERFGSTAAGTSWTGALLEAFRFYNSGVLFFGAIIMGYVTVFGIMNTAQDGQALGKKWNSGYTALRTVASAALLLPSTLGPSSVQMIVLLVATWSVGFASNTWQAIVKFSFKDELAAQAVKSVMPDKSFDTLAADALRMQICAAGMKKAAAMLGTPMDDMQLWRVDSSSEKPNAVENTTRLFYWSPRWPTARELCGQISITNQFQKLDTHSSASLAAVGRTQDKVNKIRADAALLLFFGPLSNTAKQIVAAIESESQINTAPIHAQIQQARVDLTQKMQAEAAAAFADNGNNSDLIAQFGQSWVWAGSMHMEMARIKDMIRTATQVNITFEPGSEDFSKFTVGEVADAGQHVLAPYVTTAAAISMALEKKIQNDSAIPAMPAMTTSYSVGDFINGGASVKETIHKFFKRWSDETVSGFVGYLSD